MRTRANIAALFCLSKFRNDPLNHVMHGLQMEQTNSTCLHHSIYICLLCARGRVLHRYKRVADLIIRMGLSDAEKAEGFAGTAARAYVYRVRFSFAFTALLHIRFAPYNSIFLH